MFLGVKHEPFTLILLKGSCETRGIFGVRGCRDWRSRCLVLLFGVCPSKSPLGCLQHVQRFGAAGRFTWIGGSQNTAFCPTSLISRERTSS